jgi:hypothetical protein
MATMAHADTIVIAHSDNNENWSDKRKRIRYEAYLDWLSEKTNGMSEISVMRKLQNISLEKSELLDPSYEELEPYIFNICFSRVFDQNHDFEKFIRLLKSANLSKVWRIELGDFTLETPYERFCRVNSKSFSKLNFDDSSRKSADVYKEDYLMQEAIRNEIREASDQRRSALEESCYVSILCSKTDMCEEEILHAIDEFWNSGTLLIPRSELGRAVEIKYLLELRRMNGIDNE